MDASLWAILEQLISIWADWDTLSATKFLALSLATSTEPPYLRQCGPKKCHKLRVNNDA